MTKKRSTIILIIALAVLAVIFAVVAAGGAKAGYEKKIAEEKPTEIDFYSMQSYCSENASAVMDALKSGKTNQLEALLLNAEGAEAVMGFADWRKADFKNAVSLGAGSLTGVPDDSGKIEISERFFVDAGDSRYVLFIETLTSRWGKTNDGVSAVGVTSYEHFDTGDYDWNGEPDDESALAGELWWNKE